MLNGKLIRSYKHFLGVVLLIDTCLCTEKSLQRRRQRLKPRQAPKSTRDIAIWPILDNLRSDNSRISKRRIKLFRLSDHLSMHNICKVSLTNSQNQYKHSPEPYFEIQSRQPWSLVLQFALRKHFLFICFKCL